ncbi:Ribosomal L18p/L5e family protein [Zea mays]|uniref:Ribosomal L18p/L5e family protein n=3 Tax=Zea mays TaxID=4577 RepID=A0A1D6EF92_MAIZE|nr:Ribosomal L18p/L5e family protein [Zea mays]
MGAELSDGGDLGEPRKREAGAGASAKNKQRLWTSAERPGAMVIPPPARAARVTRFLKPYLLRMHFSNKYVSAQVVHTPTATVACSASSQEKLLRPNMESTRDVAAAAKIGKLLGERLLLKGIPAVSIHMKREQKYHGKVKAVIDSVREAGVKLL